MVQGKTIVVKVGSSLLANEQRLTPRWAFMHNLLEDIARLREGGAKVILCSSGSVALGMNMIGERPETAGLRDKQAAAACGMPLLLNAYKQVAHEYSFEIAQVLVTLRDLEDRKRFLNTKNTVDRLLDANIMPIINENDTITTEEIRVGDNDRLSAKIAQMLQADELIILTQVDGLYDKDPSEAGAQLVEKVTDVSPYLAVTEGVSSLGSGGMLTKIQAAHMAQNAGCDTRIAHGEYEHPVTSVLNEERRHTRIMANERPESAWANWLSDRLQMAGSIVVNAATAEAFKHGRRNIGREDVLSIQGPYVKGDVIHIYGESGDELARGLTNFSSDETMALARNPTLSAMQLLGYKTLGTLITDKNMVVLDDRHLTWDLPAGEVMTEVIPQN
ncbi:glutamate 5-kinase [Sphingopyxis sp. BSNA05]|uniref:glutamate 5-kinase n=1 Tax=Sphingomonadales TaxID=204457 RepID=UPI000C1F5EBF|nr:MULTISPECIES: glutamate 5-kinase [Sphingomonadaceae]ATW02479.1 glutamate 5-kinase [Sphingorhabdus sp. YGSMI21]NRD90374.1 glutamate 5-kinase [Sphingopyxis sp. BSNA05]